MTAVHETAYRDLKPSYTNKEVELYFQPSQNEIDFALKAARKPMVRLAILVHIKTLHRIGRFRMLGEIPVPIARYMMRFLPKCNYDRSKYLKLDNPASRNRILKVTRKYTGTTSYDSDANIIAKKVAADASRTKDKIPDIINVMIEELIRNHYELPGFSTLVKIANFKRKEVNAQYYQELNSYLDSNAIERIDNLLKTDETDGPYSEWHRLKTEPGKPTNKELSKFLNHFKWLRNWTDILPDISFIPVTKRKQFMLEARALDAADLKKVRSTKRYSLITVLFYSHLFSATDNLINLFIKKVNSMHSSGLNRLRQYQLQKMKNAEKLIKQLRDMLNAYQSTEDDMKRISKIRSTFKENPEKLLEECDEHIAYADDNYYPFLVAPYTQNRSMLFNCLSLLTIHSTTSDDSIILALKYVLENQKSRREFYPIDEFESMVGIESLHWMQKKWKRIVLVKTGKNEISVNRKFFELCLFSQITRELNSADLVITESSEYSDLEKQLIDKDEYDQQVSSYCEMMGFPDNIGEFVDSLRERLKKASRDVDNSYHDNKGFYIDDNGLHIRKPKKVPEPENLKLVEDKLRQKLKSKSVLDILTDVEAWTDLHKKFGPLSGFKSKLKDQRLRIITTLFCYGFNLGPSQTAQSVTGLTRKQVAWSNQKHITEENLDQVIFEIVNIYNRFTLPNYWGDGSSVSADGTMWNVYEKNLLSEYHIRYGGYGGIGYYHVSNKYIALFSHFIPCGVYEAIYILDGLIKNKSDIKPDVIHGDTHAQSYTVFGLSHLLGIELMPRIRDIKNLKFYRYDKNQRYDNIDSLFKESIDWGLIERHMPDMLRVALSIKAGKVEPSAILRRLGTESRKNRLYFAFRELGRVMRTIFLLKYISDIDLRKNINAETNKCEQFNDYMKWLFFGNKGVIAENLRHKQTKIIKYSHLVANMVILYNVEHMTRAFRELKKEGAPLDESILSNFNPFRKSNINRYGSYNIKMRRNVRSLSYDKPIL